MNINQAQQIPLMLLVRLGYAPVKTYKGGVELAFRSPFRQKTTASFFVNVHKNVWNGCPFFWDTWESRNYFKDTIFTINLMVKKCKKNDTFAL